MLTHQLTKEQALLHAVTSQLAGFTGVQCEVGTLMDRQNGFPPETVYIDLTANSIQSAVYAERKLSGIGGIPTTRWQTGWTEVSGRKLRIRIYPKST